MLKTNVASDREHEGEEQDARVDGGGIWLAPGIGAGHEANQSGGNDGRNRQARGRSGQSEQSAFDKQLRDDAAALCAERVAHGHFAGAGRGAQQQ